MGAHAHHREPGKCPKRAARRLANAARVSKRSLAVVEGAAGGLDLLVMVGGPLGEGGDYGDPDAIAERWFQLAQARDTFEATIGF